MDETEHAYAEASPDLRAVLDSAARLQELVPDAVLVGGSAAALYAGHRDSYDHDHVVADLRDRFEVVLEALESEGEWVTNRVRPGKIILGSLGDIETGVRQLIRRRPLETAEIELGSGRSLRVPTPAETLRVKAFLIVRRNQTRDYLDVAALSARYGVERAAAVLGGIDEFYADQGSEEEGVRSQLIRQLSEPRPADFEVTAELIAYRNLSERWTDWSNVVAACAELAEQIARG
ncbi:hypothetical protein L0U85_19930 [Glycomyces sp. L485]|uniref:hypothetical protein n=1 Tax=Glycomyces sp. L485 TaxID=2909235 RepID=UPI001F4A1580|nr:hypothetical protein [Glycomyces sp. L485]MCH7233107.1 hypothetical protein [Glycomyces sp. L485]